MKNLCFLLLFTLILVSKVPAAEIQQQDEFIFKGELILGTIEKIDLNKNTVLIKNNNGSMTELVIDEKETIIWIDDDEKELSSVKLGYNLEAKYRINEKNQKVASWLDMTTEDDELVASETEKKETTVKQKAIEPTPAQTNLKTPNQAEITAQTESKPETATAPEKATPTAAKPTKPTTEEIPADTEKETKENAAA